MKELVIYVHGKGGEAEEAEHYKPFFPKSDDIGFDYKSQNAKRLPYAIKKAESKRQRQRLILALTFYRQTLNFRRWNIT